ncbi:fasciclin domain-containing protein [Streptomyces sp. NPDC048256]|uniref:fasciclin domain-containing protein n=1 Tax=Streptomyces sp. NPDC048256 TaxID=3154613 RepID=UPI0033D17F5D
MDTALVVPEVDATAWRLRIHGRGVARPVTLSFDELLRRDLIERDITLTCVSNEVGGPYVGNARWIGVRLADLTAVKKAGLVDTLNNAQNITVFAPTNDAFAKIPKSTLDKVLNDKAQLTKILTYHVVGQKLTPKDLENGSFDTLEKSKVTTSSSGESCTVNDSAKVVCGNVKTANAHVYIIDTVLMPTG